MRNKLLIFKTATGSGFSGNPRFAGEKDRGTDRLLICQSDNQCVAKWRFNLLQPDS